MTEERPFLDDYKQVLHEQLERKRDLPDLEPEVQTFATQTDKYIFKLDGQFNIGFSMQSLWSPLWIQLEQYDERNNLLE